MSYVVKVVNKRGQGMEHEIKSHASISLAIAYAHNLMASLKADRSNIYEYNPIDRTSRIVKVVESHSRYFRLNPKTGDAIRPKIGV